MNGAREACEEHCLGENQVGLYEEDILISDVLVGSYIFVLGIGIGGGIDGWISNMGCWVVGRVD